MNFNGRAEGLGVEKGKAFPKSQEGEDKRGEAARADGVI